MEPSSFRLAFAPPFVFIRGSRGTLTATCRYVGLLSVFLPPDIPGFVFEGSTVKYTRSTPLLKGPVAKSSGKSLSFRHEGKNGTRVTRRASHDYVISSRLAFIIQVRDTLASSTGSFPHPLFET